MVMGLEVRPPCPEDGTEYRKIDKAFPFTTLIARIRHHCKVLGHIETGYENRVDVVSAVLLMGELNQRLVVTFSICRKFMFRLRGGIFGARWVHRQQCRAAISGELEWATCAIFQEPGRHILKREGRGSSKGQDVPENKLRDAKPRPAVLNS